MIHFHAFPILFRSDDAAEKYEIKGRQCVVNQIEKEVFLCVVGVDEEMKVVPDIEKKLEQMDENNGEIDFFDDDEEEEVPDMGLSKSLSISCLIIIFLQMI